MEKFIYYLPRTLVAIIVVFISTFIIEGFSPGFSWQDSLMHLLVALFALGVATVAWKRPRVGGWIFILLGLTYLLVSLASGRLWLGVFIGGVPLITGILFLVEGFRKKLKNQ